MANIRLYTNEPAFCTTGVIDDEFVVEHSILINEVTIANGLFQDGFIPTKAFVWFDNIEANHEIRKLLLDAGVKKENIVCFTPTMDLDDAIFNISWAMRQCKCPNDLASLDEIEDIDTRKIPHYRTGIKALDDAISGLYVGQVSVLFSYSGEGKSTLASSIMCNIATNTDCHCLAYSGELEPHVFKDWTLHQLASKAWIDKLDDYKPYMTEVIGDKIRLLKNHSQFVTDMSKADADRVVSAVMDGLQRAVDYDPEIKFIMVDNLMTAMDECPAGSDVLVAQSNFMQDLVDFAVDRKVHVMLICHCKKENFKSEMNMYDISGSSNIPNKASTIMSIRRDDKSGYSYLSLYKDRYSGARLLNEGGDVDNRVLLQYQCDTHNFKYCLNNDPQNQDDWRFMPLRRYAEEVATLYNADHKGMA